MAITQMIRQTDVNGAHKYVQNVQVLLTKIAANVNQVHKLILIQHLRNVIPNVQQAHLPIN